MLKRIGAVLVGLVVAIAIVFSNDLVDVRFYPPPAGFDWHDVAAVNAFIASLPVGALLIVLVGWFLATFAGGYIALTLSTGDEHTDAADKPQAMGEEDPGARRAHERPAWMIAMALMIGAVGDMTTYTHPTWFWAATLVLIPSAAVLAVQMSNRN